MYYLNYFFIFSIIGHLIETIFVENFNSGILFGYWTPVYGVGVILILLINNFINKFNFNKKIIFKIFLTYFSCMIVLSLVELLGGYLIEFIFDKEFWNYEKHKFNIGPYISLEISNMWGIASIILIYIIKPTIDKLEKHIPKLITFILMFLFILDCVCTVFIK